MSSLTHIEKQRLERELEMGGGYVLNFSNRTFEEFFREVVGVEIYNPRFDRASGSKAHRMRAFWDASSDAQVATLLEGLIEAWDIYSAEPISSSTREVLQNVIQRLTGKERASKFAKPEARMKVDGPVSDALLEKLMWLPELSPQLRGYEFERFLINTYINKAS